MGKHGQPEKVVKMLLDTCHLTVIMPWNYSLILHCSLIANYKKTTAYWIGGSHHFLISHGHGSHIYCLILNVKLSRLFYSPWSCYKVFWWNIYIMIIHLNVLPKNTFWSFLVLCWNKKKWNKEFFFIKFGF